jgi:hypothetical protein
MRVLSLVVFAFACFAFNMTTLKAQTTSTEILGTVSDPSGAVLPGATITITRVATGEKRETTTNDSGDYSFPLIEIGEYIVKVQLPGFKTQEKTNVVVQLQQKARINFVMHNCIFEEGLLEAVQLWNLELSWLGALVVDRNEPPGHQEKSYARTENGDRPHFACKKGDCPSFDTKKGTVPLFGTASRLYRDNS